MKALLYRLKFFLMYRKYPSDVSDFPYVYRKWYSLYTFFIKDKGTIKEYFERKQNRKKLMKEAMESFDKMSDEEYIKIHESFESKVSEGV